MRLSFTVDPKGKVPVKVISKTFASGKTEKLVYSALAELGLPNGKASGAFEQKLFDIELLLTLINIIIIIYRVTKWNQRLLPLRNLLFFITSCVHETISKSFSSRCEFIK